MFHFYFSESKTHKIVQVIEITLLHASFFNKRHFFPLGLSVD